MTDFDFKRAYLAKNSIFQPFNVKNTRSLEEALASGIVSEDTPVLIMENVSEPLALLTRQMSYHHIAQGEIGGEPWLATF